MITDPNHPVLALAIARRDSLTWTGSGHSFTYAPDSGLAVAYWPRTADDGSSESGGGTWVALEREVCPESGIAMTRSAILYETNTPTPDDELVRGAAGIGVPSSTVVAAYVTEDPSDAVWIRTFTLIHDDGSTRLLKINRAKHVGPVAELAHLTVPFYAGDISGYHLSEQPGTQYAGCAVSREAAERVITLLKFPSDESRAAASTLESQRIKVGNATISWTQAEVDEGLLDPPMRVQAEFLSLTGCDYFDCDKEESSTQSYASTATRYTGIRLPSGGHAHHEVSWTFRG